MNFQQNNNWYDLDALIKAAKSEVALSGNSTLTNEKEQLLLWSQKPNSFISTICMPIFSQELMGCRITLTGAKGFVPYFDLAVTDARSKGLRESSFMKSLYQGYIERAKKTMTPFMAYIILYWVEWARATYPEFKKSHPGGHHEITTNLLQELLELSRAGVTDLSSKEIPVTRLGFITGAWYNDSGQQSKTSISVAIGGGKSVTFDNLTQNVEDLLYRHCDVIDRKDGTFVFGKLYTVVNERLMCAALMKRNETAQDLWGLGIRGQHVFR